MVFTPEMVAQALSVLTEVQPGSDDGLQLVSAAAMAGDYYPRTDPGRPLLILGDIPETADALRSTLLQAYPADHPVRLLRDNANESVTLGELAPGGGPAALYVPPLPYPATYEALQEVAAHLRAPEGCPWDRELTWDRLRATLLEEAHELLAALDAQDPHKVREELGDLLLQVAMQTQIASEHGLFRLPEVIAGIVDKLVRRHPHVFGDVAVTGSDEVLANWEAIKAAERAGNGEKRSPLAGVPAGLPSLAQADAYLARMSRLRRSPAPDAPWEALASLAPEAEGASRAVGEVLFGIVAWARARGIDAESALREANARFAADVLALDLG